MLILSANVILSLSKLMDGFHIQEM